MTVNRKTLICIFSFILGFIIDIMGFITYDTTMQNIGILFLFLACIFYCLADFYDRIFFMAYMICFFTFLLGRTVAYLLTGKEEIYGFSSDIIRHTNICVSIALVSLLIGYVIAQKRRLRLTSLYDEKPKSEDIYSSSKYINVRLISRILFYVTFPFDLLIGLEKFVFVRTMGYAQYYVSYTSRFPYVFVKLADVSVIAFYIFLATFPNKKEMRIPLGFFLVHAIVLLGSGKRAEFIVPLMLLILYFSVRNTINSGGRPWITGRNFRMILILLPFLLAAMFAYNSSRFSGSNSSSVSFVEQVAGFFENTGFSVNVISFEKYYESSIPDKLYSIGDTIDYLRENVLTQLFFDFPVYKPQTVEKALNGNNFSQTITYLRSQSYYLSGRGYGSCYIAEAYHDFGYMGIVVWSIIYSFVLANAYDFRKKGIAYVTIWLSALHFVLISPRNMASTFISELININSWLVIGVVFVAANILSSRNSE